MRRAAECVAPSDGSTLDRESFAAIFRRHPAGVCVVTLHDGRRPIGFTATSVISVAVDPALLAFSINATSSSWPGLEQVDDLMINFLSDGQSSVSTTFATSGIDRFADVAWSPHPTGAPMIDHAAGWIAGRVVDRIVAGASRLIVVEALEAAGSVREPLVYRDRHYQRLVDYEI